MKRSKWIWAVGVSGIALAGLALAGHGGKVDWVGDFEKGKEQARRESKPMMLYFTADG